MDKLTIWALDISTRMTYGSAFLDELPPFSRPVILEPWTSALEMLRRFWELADWPQGLVAWTDTRDPNARNIIVGPPLDTDSALGWLKVHGPSGWDDFSASMQHALNIAYSKRETHACSIIAVNVGPVWFEDDINVPRFISLAQNIEVPIHVIPMGNTPGPFERFPNLAPLQRIASETGGRIFYEPNYGDITDFSMLPGLVQGLIEVLS